MIHYISGRLMIKKEGIIVVETGGLGFEVNVPMNSAAYLLAEGEEIKIYTSMMVKEDDISLYGFMDREAQMLFERLITVSGIGAKAAMAVLSAMPLDEVVGAITFGDITALTRAAGVGKKSAERIIVDLKDKLADIGEVGHEGRMTATMDDERNEAVAALVELGYSKAEAASAVAGIKGDSLALEDYIKQALSRI